MKVYAKMSKEFQIEEEKKRMTDKTKSRNTDDGTMNHAESTSGSIDSEGCAIIEPKGDRIVIVK